MLGQNVHQLAPGRKFPQSGQTGCGKYDMIAAWSFVTMKSTVFLSYCFVGVISEIVTAQKVEQASGASYFRRMKLILVTSTCPAPQHKVTGHRVSVGVVESTTLLDIRVSFTKVKKIVFPSVTVCPLDKLAISLLSSTTFWWVLQISDTFLSFPLRGEVLFR